MNKVKKIASITLMVLISLMLLMSAFFKLSGAEQVVTGLSAVGLGGIIPVLGILEIVAVVLFLVPRTNRIGFLLICSYLGGAASIELATGQFPMALVFIALAWISEFLRTKAMFIPQTTGNLS